MPDTLPDQPMPIAPEAISDLPVQFWLKLLELVAAALLKTVDTGILLALEHVPAFRFPPAPLLDEGAECSVHSHMPAPAQQMIALADR
jgi:hypothetical protein